ncbi:MAG: lipoyl(octanoyl) transferase LipB [Rhodothalassiaceae bacterium]
MMVSEANSPVEWQIFEAPVAYERAVAAMEQRVAAIRAGLEPECVWLLEHPPLYTAGTSARPGDLLVPNRFPVYRTGRGGQFTYHGPGQRVAYVMLDLKRRGGDLRRYIADLEGWLIATLARFGVTAEIRPDRVGVWVVHEDGREEKIAAIGVRVRRWVSYHGIALNVAPDLDHFTGIVPCGIREHGVTSLAALGIAVGMPEVDAALRVSFAEQFGCDLVDVAAKDAGDL